jgi:hypothetical protein
MSLKIPEFIMSVFGAVSGTYSGASLFYEGLKTLGVPYRIQSIAVCQGSADTAVSSF